MANCSFLHFGDNIFLKKLPEKLFKYKTIRFCCCCVSPNLLVKKLRSFFLRFTQ